MRYNIVTKIDLIREESVVTRTWILFRGVSIRGGLTPICTIQFFFFLIIETTCGTKKTIIEITREKKFIGKNLLVVTFLKFSFKVSIK